jgi:eukaryotic-like serine/threonine-protein kinase
MVGQKLAGRYLIDKMLRRSGFGTTFIALDTQRPGNPKCVVKHLTPRNTDENTLREAQRLFIQEAEMLEQLGKHSQIPQLLAYFEENQEFYLVQEYIEGDDLTEEIPPVHKPLSEVEVIQLLKEILEVLNFVHQNNVIHRDIKPSNIRRRKPDNQIVLIDFGAVKQIKGLEINQQGQTSFTIAIGTPGYMPSEQADGTPKFSSDIYAVGVIGIQAWTGMYPEPQRSYRLPKHPDTGEIIWRTQAQEGSKLADILDAMVRYHFNQRYPTAESALQAIQQLLSANSLEGPDTILDEDPPSPQKIPSIKWLIGGGIFATVAAISIVFSQIPNIPKSQESFSSYENPNYGIKIKYPDSWSRLETPNPLTKEVVTFLSPKQSQNDQYQEKITISVEDFSGTLADANDAYSKEIKSILPEAKIIEQSSTILAYKPANQLIFTGKDGGNKLKNLQILTLRGQQAYIITYTAEINDYDKFYQTAEKMIKSFEMQ